jgi:hypothetical protein
LGIAERAIPFPRAGRPIRDIRTFGRRGARAVSRKRGDTVGYFVTRPIIYFDSIKRLNNMIPGHVQYMICKAPLHTTHLDVAQNKQGINDECEPIGRHAQVFSSPAHRLGAVERLWLEPEPDHAM